MTSPTPGPHTTAPATATPSLTPPAAATTGTTPAPEPMITVSAACGGGLTAAVLSAAVIAAGLTALVNGALARRSTRLEERARVRATLAEAYQAYAAYKEFPYAIRRRRADQPANERVRLSEALREVQSRLSYYQAWTQAESPETGAAYNELITQVRRIAGAAMREAWKAPPLDNDEGMNIGLDLIDLTGLASAEKKFIDTMNAHVTAVTRSWWHRAGAGITRI